MKKRWRNAGLYVLLVIVMIAVGTAFLDRPEAANAPRTLRYSDFVEAVQGNEVSRVLISPDRGTAEIILAKNRHGPTGTAECRFDGALSRFTLRDHTGSLPAVDLVEGAKDDGPALRGLDHAGIGRGQLAPLGEEEFGVETAAGGVVLPVGRGRSGVAADPDTSDQIGKVGAGNLHRLNI